jgi:4-hydroxy-2-oxoheptanedioate aldolase
MTTLPGFSLAARLRAGETVHCGWCAIAAPMVAEVIAREGFGAVTLDSQHGTWDLAGLLAGIAAVRQAGSAPLVRVPLGDFAMVSRVLDCGAEGVIAPMINTAADARAFAAAAKYPPIGERSWGPQRAAMLAGIANQKDYLVAGNDVVVTLAMIETRTALANLDAIAATPGIDGLFLGPSDLSIALSEGKSLDPESQDVEAGLDRIVAAAQRAGKIAGAYCASAPRALAVAKRGVRFCAIASDTAFLRAGARAQLDRLKS